MNEKILACLRAYRRECQDRDNPHLYNDFMTEFKFKLVIAKKLNLLLDVASEDLGLISKADHSQSKVKEDEAKK